MPNDVYQQNAKAQPFDVVGFARIPAATNDHQVRGPGRCLRGFCKRLDAAARSFVNSTFVITFLGEIIPQAYFSRPGTSPAAAKPWQSLIASLKLPLYLAAFSRALDDDVD